MKEVKQLLDEMAILKMNNFPLASYRRPGMAYRNKEISAAHRNRRA